MSSIIIYWKNNKVSIFTYFGKSSGVMELLCAGLSCLASKNIEEFDEEATVDVVVETFDMLYIEEATLEVEEFDDAIFDVDDAVTFEVVVRFSSISTDDVIM